MTLRANCISKAVKAKTAVIDVTLVSSFLGIIAISNRGTIAFHFLTGETKDASEASKVMASIRTAVFPATTLQPATHEPHQRAVIRLSDLPFSEEPISSFLTISSSIFPSINFPNNFVRQSINSFFTNFYKANPSARSPQILQKPSAHIPPILTTRLRLLDPSFSLGVAAECKLISSTVLRGHLNTLYRPKRFSGTWAGACSRSNGFSTIADVRRCGRTGRRNVRASTALSSQLRVTWSFLFVTRRSGPINEIGSCRKKARKPC